MQGVRLLMYTAPGRLRTAGRFTTAVFDLAAGRFLTLCETRADCDSRAVLNGRSGFSGMPSESDFCVRHHEFQLDCVQIVVNGTFAKTIACGNCFSVPLYNAALWTNSLPNL